MDINFSLHPAQLSVFNSEARFKVAACGRRFGKSYLAAVELIIEAMKDYNEYGYNLKNKEVWYIAPTFNQAKDIMWSVLKDLGQDVIESTVENTATLRLINGRKIQLKGSDRPDTLRGVGISFVVLDEYAFMKPEVWETIIRPTLSDVKGRALFIGTPEGKNHFYELFKKCQTDPFSETFQFASIDNPFLDPLEIETARQSMSRSAFMQEYEASFETTGGGIFSEDMLIMDDKEPAEGFYYIAVDPAGFEDVAKNKNSNYSRLDDTAIAVVKVGPYGWWVKDIDAGRWNVRETAARILRHAQKVHTACVGIEKGALMNALMPYMEDKMRQLNVYPRIEPVSHGGVKKATRITWALQGRFEHGKIFLNPGPWNDKFIEQLLDFPNPLSHDDMVDALAYIDQVAVTNYNQFMDIEEWEPLDPIAGV